MTGLVNYIALGHLNVTQAFELMYAPDEVKQQVLVRIESGEKVTPKEIQELKAEVASKDGEKEQITKEAIKTVLVLGQKPDHHLVSHTHASSRNAKGRCLDATCPVINFER